jgi:hypothetical protein
MLAEEIVRLCSGQRGMAIGGADHAKLIGVGAGLLFQFQTDLQRRSRVFARQHVVPLGIQAAALPNQKAVLFARNSS